MPCSMSQQTMPLLRIKLGTPRHKPDALLTASVRPTVMLYSFYATAHYVKTIFKMTAPFDDTKNVNKTHFSVQKAQKLFSGLNR